MKSAKFTPSGTLTAGTVPRPLVLTFLFMSSLLTCQVATAQNIQLQPVARLITEPTTDARHSRPRKVAINEGPALKNSRVTSPSLEEATEVERRAFEKANEARIQNGMAVLTWDPQLCRMARVHSANMARGGFFSHQTPEGLEIKARARQAGIQHFRVIGENIAYNKGYDDPGGFAVERWMISSGHRANMLYIGFQSSAIGSYIAADGTVFLTQVLMAR